MTMMRNGMCTAACMVAVIGWCSWVVSVQASPSVYHVSAVRDKGVPVVSRTQSSFSYTYNPAQVVAGGDGARYLLARVQDYNATQGPYAVGPSKLAAVKLGAGGLSAVGAVSTVVFEPTEAYEKCGTEDPRVVQHNGVTYLTYTAYDCHKAALALATSTSPLDAGAWQRHGLLFPSLPWSKSGATLLRPQPPHYMFFGDSTDVPGLRIATSDDLLHWSIVTNSSGGDKLLIRVRPKSFDSHLIEGGPPPVQLSDGNYLFVYNSARAGFPSVKPGYSLQYNPGYVVLDGSDPTTVLQRSEDPLMSPTLPWETGNSSAFLTPNVIFMEARFPVSTNTFQYYYGAADTFIGVANITVSMP